MSTISIGYYDQTLTTAAKWIAAIGAQTGRRRRVTAIGIFTADPTSALNFEVYDPNYNLKPIPGGIPTSIQVIPVGANYYLRFDVELGRNQYIGFKNQAGALAALNAATGMQYTSFDEE